MIARYITCITVGHYALTRGRKYELLATAGDKQLVRLRDDKGRLCWYLSDGFDLNGGDVTVLESWRFDEDVVDTESGRDENDNWVDITLTFSDGTRRWCQMVTPDYLKHALNDPFGKPAICAHNLIVVRDLKTETVQQVLYQMDQDEELEKFSLLLESSVDDEPQDSE